MMFKKYIVLSSFLLLSTYILLIDNFNQLGQVYFYTIVPFILYSIISNKKIQLIDVWNLSFVFIILSEVFIRTSATDYMVSAIQYLIVANNLINIGYLTKSNNYFSKKRNIYTVYRDSRVVITVLFCLVLFYFFMEIKTAIMAFTLGRMSTYGDGGNMLIISSLTNSLGLVLPSIMAYYFIYIKRKSILIPFLLSLPIFIILFMGGTRFPLLFSFLGFILVVQGKIMKKLTLKNSIVLATSILLLVSVSSRMKDFRSTGISNPKSSIVQNHQSFKDIPTYLAANYMSPEGVVDMTALMFKHFEKNDHLYGASSSFILYFWVPRAIWPEKPTMLGYWFIRQYRGGFGDAHSASFGFTGDLYADFGLFSLIIVFFLGRLLKTAENFKRRVFIRGDYSTVLRAMFYPFIFFFVRSPITSTMTFLGIIFIYYIMKRVMFAKHI